MKITSLTLSALIGFGAFAQASVVGFEALAFQVGFNYENGAHLSGVETSENLYGADVTVRRSTFSSSGSGMTAFFDNEYVVEWGSWSGWAYSKDTDATTSGFGNQFSAITGSGSRGSENYGLSFGNSVINFADPQDFSGRGFDVTNSTWAHNGMRDGDGGFADPFEAGSFFYLSVEGFLSGASTGTLDFYLADFTSTDPDDHYILNDWAFVNLTALGTLDSLAFSLTSSDAGIPNYFAIDNIGVVPEPAGFALVLGGVVLLVTLRRRRA